MSCINRVVQTFASCYRNASKLSPPYCNIPKNQILYKLFFQENQLIDKDDSNAVLPTSSNLCPVHTVLLLSELFSQYTDLKLPAEHSIIKKLDHVFKALLLADV